MSKGYRHKPSCKCSFCLNISTRKGQKNSKEHNIKIGEANKIALKRFYENNPKAKERVREQLLYYSKKNKAKNLKKLHKDPTWIAKISKKHKEKWKNPKFRESQLKKIFKGLLKRPTSFEKRFSELCIEKNLPFIYTGDGRFFVNYKNPDFVDKSNKIAIEVFFSYYKIRDYGSIKNYKEFCKKKYNYMGWKVIFLDENDIWFPKNWKEKCLNKLELCGDYQVEVWNQIK